MCEYMEILNTGRHYLCKGQLLNNCIFAMTDRGLRETIIMYIVRARVRVNECACACFKRNMSKACMWGPTPVGLQL